MHVFDLFCVLVSFIGRLQAHKEVWGNRRISRTFSPPLSLSYCRIKEADLNKLHLSTISVMLFILLERESCNMQLALGFLLTIQSRLDILGNIRGFSSLIFRIISVIYVIEDELLSDLYNE